MPRRKGTPSAGHQPLATPLLRRLEAVSPVALRATRQSHVAFPAPQVITPRWMGYATPTQRHQSDPPQPKQQTAQRWALEEVVATLERLAAQRVCEFLVVSDADLLREWQAVAASGLPPASRADLAQIAALRPLGRLALVGWQLGNEREASALHPLALAEDVLRQQTGKRTGKAPARGREGKQVRRPPVGWKATPQIRIGQWLFDEIAVSSWPETPMRRLLLRIERLLHLLDEWPNIPVEVCLTIQRRGAPFEVFEETHLVTQATEWRRAALRVLG